MMQPGTVRRTALITGASAGIGTAFAHVFALRGFDLVVTARRIARLEALANQLREQQHVTVHVYRKISQNLARRAAFRIT
jgi:short-subunit dehydrogenase